MQKFLVFTDLDGTLLDHESYSFEFAKESLERLKKKKIPIIISTSKTFAEVEELQKKLGIGEPFIVENGAGIYIPKNSIFAPKSLLHQGWMKISDAYTYNDLRLFFQKMQKKYPIKGFGDMDIEEVVALTNLPKADALRAMQREYTEPFLLHNESLLESLKLEANRSGMDIIKGGRFYHLFSSNQDKSEAMLKLTALYNQHYEISHKTLALGDSYNDFKMLKKADIGVLIPKYDNTFADLVGENVYRAKYPGPKGWNHAIKRFIDD